jgi:hypothetical protein
LKNVLMVLISVERGDCISTLFIPGATTFSVTTLGIMVLIVTDNTVLIVTYLVVRKNVVMLSVVFFSILCRVSMSVAMFSFIMPTVLRGQLFLPCFQLSKKGTSILSIW